MSSLQQIWIEVTTKSKDVIHNQRICLTDDSTETRSEECDNCGLIMPMTLLYICEECLYTYCLDCVTPKSHYKTREVIRSFCSEQCKHGHQMGQFTFLVECDDCHNMVLEREIQCIDTTLGQMCFSCLDDMLD